MPLNHYVTLGRSGLRVSPFCLGTMTFGEEWGWGSSEHESGEVLARYFDLGGNFVDTANFYTKGHSEKILGDLVGSRPHLRQRVVLATKFFSNLHPGDPNGGGCNAKAIHAQLAESLRRLRTDHVDLYWMHAWDRFTPIEETMRALDDVVRAGKVRYVGFSDTPAWKVAQAQTMALLRGWSPLVALQIEYSLLERTVEADLVPCALELGLGVTPWAPLKSGVLSGKYVRGREANPARGEWVSSALTPRAFDVLDVLVRVAAETGSTPARTALAWVQGRPGVSSTILGARTVAQLDDNLGALDVVLTPAQRAALDEASRPVLPFPHDFLAFADAIANGGTTVGGEAFPVLPNAPASDGEIY